MLQSSKRKAAGADGQAEQVPAGPPKLIVESYTPPDPGPYPQDKPPENTVRFTPVQVGLAVDINIRLTRALCPSSARILHLLHSDASAACCALA